jgi:hypothetical protein
MKNLIIHPKDPSTNFLSPIYVPLSNKTVIDGDVTKSELRKLIEMYDRIIMLGHGTPHGLLSVGQFPDAEFYVISHPMAYVLMNKKNNVFVWCDSDLFVLYNDLSGLCCGMFISEIEEVIEYGFEEWIQLMNQMTDSLLSWGNISLNHF